jgi:hypothetical protein
MATELPQESKGRLALVAFVWLPIHVYLQMGGRSHGGMEYKREEGRIKANALLEVTQSNIKVHQSNRMHATQYNTKATWCETYE